MTATHRDDIDGLRGLSVLMVMLFHTGSSPLSGGFVGVDVFFVISGFVISRMIQAEMANGTFTITGFFERRIRRLMPAMVLMIGVVYAVSWFVMMPMSFGTLGGSVAGQATFLSNMFFWRYVGNYFEAAPESQPLLHTWSLSVEEQFYIFFPFLCLLLLRRGPLWFPAFITALGLVSLGLSVVGVHVAPTLSFYAMPSRVWELMLGALCAIGVGGWSIGRSHAVVLSFGGICAIAGSALLFSDGTPFPGAAALVPAVGAAALLVAGQVRRTGGEMASPVGYAGVNAVLARRPLVFAGQLSYSLYLWHWPVFCLLAHHVLVRPLSPVEELLSWLAVIVLSVLSWRFVERPFRRKDGVLPRRPLFGVALAVTVVLVVAGTDTWWGKGHADRFPGLSDMVDTLSDQAMELEVDPLDSRCFLEDAGNWDPEACRITAPGGVPALLWGDSFAMHLSPGFQISGNTGLLTVYQYTSASCAAALDFSTFRRPVCGQVGARVLEIVRQLDIRVVILSSNWYVYLHRGLMEYRQITETIDTLKANGIEVLLVGQSPLFDFISPAERRYQLDPTGKAGELLSALSYGPGLSRQIAEAGSAAWYFDPLPGFCDRDECLFFDDGSYLFFDPGHFSHIGSARVVAAMMERLGPLVERLRADR